MKKWTSVLVLAALVVIAGLVWVVAKSQWGTGRVDAGAMPLASVTAPVAPAVQARVSVVEQQPVQVVPVQPTVSPVVSPVVPIVAADGSTRHIAQPGETVTSLAGDLMGEDNKVNRDAIISSNPSLQADPDKLVAGKSYRVPGMVEVPAHQVPIVNAPAVKAPDPEPVAVAPPAPATVLKYTAKAGDTVTQMAGAFLGSDDQTNQDAITKANPSLRADPDHVVAGKSYKIPAPDGLSAQATATPAVAAPRPAAETDADQIVAAGALRTLKYTAREGDTLSKMAIALLGSDTQENRDLILSKNADLRSNPDQVVAGHTYWIPAPVAAADVR